MADLNQLPGHTHRPASGASGQLLREGLLDGRRRLSAPGLADREDVLDLIDDVDAALARLEDGSFGVCEECDDPIENERLIADPMTRVCLGCLSPAETRDLERDLELASFVQAALLPDTSAGVDGWEIDFRYEPLGPVSGDHCDVLLPGGPDEPLHFMLGDISGKGVSASILMSHLHAIFRSLVPRSLPLGELVEHANRLFSEATLPNSYATLVAGRLSPSGTLELCNAGHCRPLLLQAGRVLTLPTTGLPLGLFSSGTYEVTRLDLGPDDLLFLYTDGLSEARNGAGEQYGEARIASIVGIPRRLSSRAAIDLCLADVSAFRADASREDDLTVMAIRRKN
jgi:sigma-B regulation protein RsbU (phosphoserine phosphatase)